MSSPKKRKSDSSNDKKKPKQAKQENEKQQYTEIQFKFELREVDTSFSALSKFVHAAEKYPDDNDYDIVGSYVQSSEECAEIFKLLDEKRRKPQEILSIFSALELIFIRLSDTGGKLELIGDNLVQRVLTYHTPVLYFSLGLNNKNQLIKKTLRLLTRMVAFSPASARAVQTELDFSHVNLLPLCQRRDIKDSQDVRTCFIHFIMAFLLIGDEIVVKQMVEQKVILQKILHGIESDKMENIQLILSTLLEKVVQSTAVSKTAKVHLFSETILKHLCQLFSWTGPKHWKELKDKKDSKAAAVSASTEERELVSEVSHAFLAELCCSFKTGINFYDASLGTAGKNQNHILTGLLSSLQKTYQQPLCAELIISVLRACPDQLHHFLSMFAPSLNPRSSTSWLAAMDFLIKIYQAQPETLPFLENKSTNHDLNHVSMSLVYILPPDKVMSSFSWGVKQQSQPVRHKLLEFLKLVLQRTEKILSSIQSVEGDISQGLGDRIKEVVLKKLPDGATLLGCLHKLREEKTGDSAKDTPGKEALPPVSAWQYLVSVEQVLCLYQDLLPSLLSDSPAHISVLLEAVRTMGGASQVGRDNEMEEENEEREVGGAIEVGGAKPENEMLPQLYLLKLLAGTDARQLPWGKENAAKHTLMYLLLEMVTKATGNQPLTLLTQDLVCKLLMSTGLFSGQEQELSLWLSQLKESDTSSVVDFTARLLTSFISNPYPYMDRLADIIAEVMVDTGQEKNKSGRSRVQEKTISEILSMDMTDDWESWSQAKHQKHGGTASSQMRDRFSFSPLTLVGQDLMSSEVKFKDNAEVMEFLRRIQTNILHTQLDPVLYSTLLHHHGNYRHSQYLTSWMTNAKPWKASKTERQSTEPSVMLQLLWGDEARRADGEFMEELTASLESLPPHRLVLLTQQLLLYIRQAVLNADKNTNIEPQIDAYFKLLASIVKTVHKAAVDPHQTDKVSAEFEMLRSSCKSTEELLKEVIYLIFLHPTVVSAFHADLSQVSTKLQSPEHILTKKTADLLSDMKDVAVTVDVRKTFHPYAENIMKALKTVQKDLQVDLVSLVLGSLKNIVPFVEPKVFHRSFLEQLLEFPSDVLIVKSKSKLSEAGELVKDLASRTLTSNGEADGQPLMQFQKVSTLVNLKTMCSDKFLSNFCKELLEAQPAYALAVNRTLARHIFDRVPEEGSVMAERVLCHNVDSREWFSEWLGEHRGKIAELKSEYADLVVCFVKLVARKNSDDARESEEMCVEDIEKIYLERSAHLLEADMAVVKVIQTLLHFNCIGVKKMEKLWKCLSSAITEQEDIKQCHLELLVNLCRGGRDDETGGVDGVMRGTGKGQRLSNLETVFELLLRALISSSGRKRGRDVEVEKYSLQTLKDVLEKEELVDVNDNISSLWLDFVKVCLKAMYEEPLLLAVIEKMAAMVYKESHDVSPPIEMLYEMLMSHSQFMQVMLGEKGQEVKDRMVSLLLSLVELCPDCCHPDHHTVLQGAYTATLSPTDQKLLKMIFLYEKNGKGLADARPFLWGAKAIEHYALKKSLASSLLKQPSMEQIVETFDAKRMLKSSLHFPLGRKLTPDSVVTPAEFQSSEDVYDPSFVLPLFCGLLSSECLVDCRKFVSSHCLGYTLTALSSADPGVRRAAYTVLARYLEHLASVKFHERLQVTYLLDTLRNSVIQSNERLTCLISLFLARVSALLLHPDDHMYRQMNNFLLLKPGMDTNNVPEFYKLFNSADLQHKMERSWLLELLSDGLRDVTDYKIMERRFTFKLIQSFYNSAMSDQYSQVRVLRVMKAACTVRPVCMDLARSHAVLTWISGAVLREECEGERGELLTSITHGLWFTMLGEGRSTRSLPEQFIRETLLCCSRLLATVRSQESSATSLLLLTDTMLSVLTKSTEPSPSAADESSTADITPSAAAVSIKEVLLLLYSCSQLQSDSQTAARVKTVLKKLGIEISVSKVPKKKRSWRKEEEMFLEEEEQMNGEEDKENTEEKKLMIEEAKAKKEEENKIKIQNNICKICLQWKLLCCGFIQIPGAIVTVFWLLRHFQQFDKNRRTQVLQWISRIFMGSSESNKLMRRMVLDSSDLSSQVLAGLLSVYSSLAEASLEAGLTHRDHMDSLTRLNSIVLSLVDQETESTTVAGHFKKDLGETRKIVKENTLRSQEKASLFFKEWLLGSRSGRPMDGRSHEMETTEDGNCKEARNVTDTADSLKDTPDGVGNLDSERQTGAKKAKKRKIEASKKRESLGLPSASGKKHKRMSLQ